MQVILFLVIQKCNFYFVVARLYQTQTLFNFINVSTVRRSQWLDFFVKFFFRLQQQPYLEDRSVKFWSGRDTAAIHYKT